jgi:hypothetical protein
MSRHSSQRKSLNFYPTAFSPLAVWLSHIAAHLKAPQAYAKTKAFKRAVIFLTHNIGE